MKQNLLSLMLLLIAGSGAFDIKAQSMVIKTKDGTESTKLLDSIQNFTFSNGTLLLKFITGSTGSYGVSTISKLYFESVPTGIADVTSKATGTITIYPNPVGNSINIQNLPGGTSIVHIYRMDGVMVLYTQVSSSSTSIDVSNLETGLYLLKVNEQVLKFIKL